ncbi:TonB-dependent receptor [Paraburkholderia sp. D15]|uniref:TonB-dependent receptor n=1 Tax=Paraburkholderia sp. D15 TaxID=2880218 RepID=UPI00247A9CC9|nr:TonB-dependent receptor [Paraburkholderia sp. D15]WGS51184.1 TonB-dependent receptor [Paraburkholderia sp. D15]
MKQRALALAIKRIIWAELALSAAIAVPAFAQSQPAATGSTAGTATTSTPAAAAPASGAAAAASADNSTATTGKGNVQQLKKFEVTGSLIRQSDKTGFQAMQVVSQKDIQASGAATVSDFLRSTAANSASSWGDNYTYSTAPGGAGIALRGLSEKYTLVLIDGQRVAPYALNTNFTDSFVDLNSLPLNMIDRIEIVKTGAVSQYGSDAIAGVVNIITKHNYQGLQLDGSLGGAQHGGAGTDKFNILGGFGNLTSDGYNFTAAASYSHTSGIDLSQRDTTSGQIFPYGNNQPTSYWLTGNGPVAVGNCAGGKTISTATSTTAAFQPGTACAYNTSSIDSLAPENEHANVKIHGDFKINDNVQAFADIWDSYSTSSITTGVAGFNGLSSPLSYSPATGPVANNNSVAATNPYNPFGVATPINYTFPNVPEGIQSTANFWSFSTGLKGQFDTTKWGSWNWATSYGHSQSVVAVTDTNVMNAAAYQNVLAGGFDFANPSATPNGLNGLFSNAEYLAISKLDVVDATISTPNLFHLPTGDVGIGFGSQFQHQSESIENPTGVGTGQNLIAGIPLQQADASRNVAAVFYQIDIPIIKNLTFSQAGRYDHYNQFGGAFSPRFALRYQPLQAFTAYASYNRGFRAPTLVESAPGASLGSQSAIDTYAGSAQYNQNVNVPELMHGNPNLQPERTRNYNVGFELSPARNTDFGFDWYKIDVSNVIGIAPLQPTVDANNPANVIRNPNSGTIDYINSQLVNFSYLHTDGFEANFHQALPTKLGTFALSTDWGYIWHFQTSGLANGSTDAAGNNSSLSLSFGGSFPRWKGNTTVSWQSPNRKWNTALTWNYTGPYNNTTLEGLVGSTPGIPAEIGSLSVFNLTASYTGFKNWTIYGGINNIFNRAPPYDPNFVQYPYYQTGYDTSLYNFIGRYAQIGATYKF